MRRPASLAQLELPLAATSPATLPATSPEPEPIPARLCARCGWYCALTLPCPVCAAPPEPTA